LVFSKYIKETKDFRNEEGLHLDLQKQKKGVSLIKRGTRGVKKKKR